MLCKELTEKIEEVYPVSYACEWDLSLIHI